MKDEDKTREELLAELAELRNQVDSLRRSGNENLTAVIRDSADGIIVVDTEGFVLLANPAAGKILRRGGETITGTQLGLPTIGNDRVEIEMVTSENESVPVEMWSSETVWEGRPAIRLSLRDLSETRAAEKALRRSELRFKAIFNQSYQFSLILDVEGNVLEINEHCLEICGEFAAKAVGRPVWEMEWWGSLSDADQKTKNAVREAQQGRIVRDETTYFDKNKQLRYGLRSFSPIYGDPGNIEFISLVGLDITEIKEAGDAIREREEILRYIIKHDPNALAVYDNDLHYLAVSDRYLEDYHLEETEVIGKHHYELFPEIPSRWKNVHQRVLQGSVEKNEDDFFIRQDGSKTYNRWECRPWYTFNGEIGGIITYTEVTTERKRAEERLVRQQKLFETMFNTIPDGVVITNTNREIILANKSMETVFGYTEEELLGKSTAIIYADTEKFTQTGDAVFNQDAPRSETFYHTYYRHKSGLEFPGETFGAKLYDSEGNWIGNLGIMRDVTERQHRELERKQLQSQLLQAQKMESIGTLAGGIAHDFNNILTAVIGFTELAMGRVERDSDIYSDLQEVATAGNRASELVRQILAFARQSGEEQKPIQVDLIAKEVIKFLRSSVPTTIEIKQNFDSKSLIMGNPTRLHQIFMNLCTNSVYAMGNDSGVLDVSLRDIVISPGGDRILGLQSGSYMEVKVSDSGSGIAPEQIEQIFEPYYTTKKQGEGTGLGLSVVHGIVESYGGKITVASTPGKGSTFTIYLPIVSERKGSGTTVEEVVPLGSERILLVDDEAPIVTIGSRMLGKLGYQVTTRTSSLEALELFRSKADYFDLVITDMTMPNMTGDDLSKEIKIISPDTPVILCTGFSKKISEETARELGINGFVYKPIVQSEFAKVVRKVIDEAKGLVGL